MLKHRLLPLIALVTLLLPLGVHADEPPSAGAVPAPQADPATLQDDPAVVSLGTRLRCPVCQGMPIGESPAPMAQDMMRQVRRMRSEGQSEQAIAEFFTERYGPWVLLDPPKQGFGLLVWMLPPAALIMGLGAALGNAAWRRALARQTAERQQAGLPPADPVRDAEFLAAVRREVGL
jgi:cytochrome c-type biogenesis protein CcmH